MKKLKNFEAFNEGLGKVGAYLNDLIKKGGKWLLILGQLPKLKEKKLR